MDAIILAGGLGKRLRDTVSDVPKPLAPINGKPFLDLLLSQVSPHTERVILAVGYKSEQIKTHYPELLISEEKSPLGTGGALKQALALAKGAAVLAMNGDSYFGIEIDKLIAFHQEKEADLTIACREEDDVSRYGSIFFDESSRITAFHEKEEGSERGWINGGVYVMHQDLLDAFPCGAFSLEQEAFPSLLNKKVFAYPSAGKFIDIGTKESYLQAQGYLCDVF